MKKVYDTEEKKQWARNVFNKALAERKITEERRKELEIEIESLHVSESDEDGKTHMPLPKGEVTIGKDGSIAIEWGKIIGEKS